MTTISVVHTKGGVGKTTSAIYLATAAAKLGRGVVVVDADPQRSAAVWAEKCRLPFEVMLPSGRLPDEELVIIDTPPGRSERIDEAIDNADLIIIPCGASPMDLSRVWPTLEATVGCPSVVLLTQVDRRANTWSKIKTDLEAKDVLVFDTMIPQRQSIRRSFGRVPSYLSAYNDLLAELDGVIVGV
ncbi:ParA-like dsDNA partitioning protein [Mycobacterium phage Steamy]|uniref:ParA-like dsDNA partitioning protein n=1 Tax=Mycobacterium phage Steamy TaxID=2250309 RepID=A0A345L0K7_9CAUD|nr:ParA-like partition protein [Mycobacterium phage Steamy]AXH48809.1 ParA-like dsDNA partitioning protein [Mycobacterium phage Steamy]